MLRKLDSLNASARAPLGPGHRRPTARGDPESRIMIRKLDRVGWALLPVGTVTGHPGGPGGRRGSDPEV